MNLKLVTPSTIILDEEVASVTLPAVLGQMTILPGHAKLTAKLVKGLLYFKSDQASPPKTKTSYQIGSGFVEVNKNKVVVLASFAE